MSENSKRPHSEKGVGPARRPSTRRIGASGLRNKPKWRRHEAETSGYLADVGLYVVLAGVLCVVLQIFVPYKRYVSVLKWLTLSLFAYFGTVMVVHIPWGEMARGLFIPTFSASTTFWTSVVAILGTTISPYLFFWQAAQEVEDVEASARRDPPNTRRVRQRVRWSAFGWTHGGDAGTKSRFAS